LYGHFNCWLGQLHAIILNQSGKLNETVLLGWNRLGKSKCRQTFSFRFGAPLPCFEDRFQALSRSRNACCGAHLENHKTIVEESNLSGFFYVSQLLMETLVQLAHLFTKQVYAHQSLMTMLEIPSYMHILQHQRVKFSPLLIVWV